MSGERLERTISQDEFEVLQTIRGLKNCLAIADPFQPPAILVKLLQEDAGDTKNDGAVSVELHDDEESPWCQVLRMPAAGDDHHQNVCATLLRYIVVEAVVKMFLQRKVGIVDFGEDVCPNIDGREHPQKLFADSDDLSVHTLLRQIRQSSVGSTHQIITEPVEFHHPDCAIAQSQ